MRLSPLARAGSILALTFAFVVPESGDARADASADLAPLLAHLAGHAARFEQMKSRAEYTFTGHIDEVDGSGHASSTKEMVLHVHPSDRGPMADVLRYTEDGADKTAEAQAKAKAKRGGRPPKRARDFHLPFLSSEQARYTFQVVERDARAPSRVRVAFTPRVVAEDAYRGSAWVDTTEGTVLSMGFAPSKTPRFVDHVNATLVFDLRTPLGLAPSKLTFEAEGGFLFFRKRYRGWATITGAHV